MTTSVCSVAHERDIRTPDGRQLHVYEAGDPRGDLILVHHGTPGSGLLWDRWAEDAGRSGIRLVGYDRPDTTYPTGMLGGRSPMHLPTPLLSRTRAVWHVSVPGADPAAGHTH